VRRLGELIINIDRMSSKSLEDNKQHDLLLEIIIGALINLSKHSSCRSTIKEMNCISILIRVSEKLLDFHWNYFLFFLVITFNVFFFISIIEYFT
jgi:hypothetical protein